MPSNLVFTESGSGWFLTGDFAMDGLYMRPADYQVVRKNATTLWLKPVNGAYDVTEFGDADVTTPAHADLDDLQAQLQVMFNNDYATQLNDIALAISEPEPLVNDVFEILAAATETDPVAGSQGKAVTVEYTVSSSGGGNSDVKLQGRVLSTWVDLDSDAGVGDSTGQLKHNIYTGGVAYNEYRIAILRNVGATAEVAGGILIQK